MPIGFYYEEHPFRNHRLQLKKDDRIYILTDGFLDQFGGKSGRKFLKRNFKNLLKEIKDNSMQTQGEIIQKTFSEWKGDRSQVDDVLVLGIRI